MEILSTPTTSHVDLPLGQIRTIASDFQVTEELGFTPEGAGEHMWLQVRKRDMNTRDVAARLAAQLNIDERQINHSGLKDRVAVTCQWFSLPWPIKRDLPTLQEEPNWQIVQQTRGLKRLRIGAHRGNHFALICRAIVGDRTQLQQQLDAVRQRGFPNYFGAQRFGRGGANLAKARSLLAGRLKASRFKRGIYLSAARSALFNQILAQRVADQSWTKVLPGEVLLLDGSNSRFNAADADLAELQARFDRGDVHTSGPMVGRGAALAERQVAALEADGLAAESQLIDGLCNAGMKQERRALRAMAIDLRTEWLADDVLKLQFTLQRGVYATALLNEIITVQEPLSPNVPSESVT